MKKPSKKVGNLVSLRQSGIIARIAAGETLAAISRDTGMDQRHLYRLAEKSHDLIGDAVAEAHDKIRRRLPSLVDQAMDILQNQMTNGSPDTRRRAARTLLNIAARMSSNRCDQCDAHHNHPPEVTITIDQQ